MTDEPSTGALTAAWEVLNAKSPSMDCFLFAELVATKRRQAAEAIALAIDKAAADEREACAKLCEEMDGSAYQNDCSDAAAAIRDRGKP